MIKATRVKFFQLLWLLFSLILFCCLIACGGSADTAGSDTATTDQSSITVTTDANYVVWGGILTATATLRDSSGNPLPNWVVTFSASSSIVKFTPLSATALTNASGQASIQVSPAAIDSAGALNITASAVITVDGVDKTVTSSPAGISVGGANVTLHSLTLGTSSISSYGTSTVSAVVWVDGAPATTPVSVAFTSTCVGLGKATLTTPVSTIGGTATSTYKDNNCGYATDRIYASVTGGGSLYTDITVTPPSPTSSSSINFVSATPSTIGTSTSPLTHSSIVKFQIVDSYNNPVTSGVLVDFTLLPSGAPGGITLSATSATSDEEGNVTVTVNSGTVPTPVWVVATIHGSSPAITNRSNTLTITTGLPSQKFFSLSVSTFNIEGWLEDGMTSTLNIIASDRLGTPIPDNTVINFISEGGSIAPSCTTSGGACSVTFSSADDRPLNGRVSILAYILGEESFVDANGNNSYDSGETYVDLGDPFIDNDEDGIHDIDEQYIHYGSGTAYSTGDGAWGQNYVRANTEIVLSGRYATIAPTSGSFGTTSCTHYFPITMADLNNNPMPVGTTVAVEDNSVYYTPNGETTAAEVGVTIPIGTPVPNTNSSTGTSIVLKVKADCSAGTPVHYPAGSVTLIVTTPKGYQTLQTFTIN